MGMQELKNKYGAGRSLSANAAINAAIRAELPCGAAVLDAMHNAYELQRRGPQLPARLQAHVERLWQGLQEEQQRMKDEIARKYGFAKNGE